MYLSVAFGGMVSRQSDVRTESFVPILLMWLKRYPLDTDVRADFQQFLQPYDATEDISSFVGALLFCIKQHINCNKNIIQERYEAVYASGTVSSLLAWLVSVTMNLPAFDSGIINGVTDIHKSKHSTIRFTYP